MKELAAIFDTFKETRLAVLVDDVDTTRAAIVAPAQEMSAGQVNNILTLTGGLTFVAISAARASALLLSVMSRPRLRAGPVPSTASLQQLVSVEAREGITTGISSADRALTISLLGAPAPQARSLVKPGHVFPVETRDGGVLVKAARPEGALDIVTSSGFTDAALFVDLLDAAGALMNAEQAYDFAEHHKLPSISITDLIRYRLAREQIVSRAAEARLPTSVAGELRAIAYRSSIHDVEHIALVKGDVADGGPVLVRVQPENTVTDVFGGNSLSSRRYLHTALELIGERTRGVVIYLRRPFVHERSTQVQTLEKVVQQPAALMREYGVGAQILRDLGVTKIELLTSSTKPLPGLSSFGIEVVAQHAISEPHQECNP